MKSIIFFFLHWILLVSLCFSTVFKSNFSTTSVDEELRTRVVANTNLNLTDKPVTSTIECFDVNEDGLIALGHTGATQGVISIYSTDGTFKYGYEFDCSGAFGVEWDKDVLNIYFVRGSLLVSVASSGEITSVLRVEDTIENNSYYNNFIRATNRNVNNMDYEMRNKFLSSYSQLVITDDLGKEMVLYSAETSQLTQNVIVSLVAIVFIAIGIIVIVSQFRRSKQ